MTTGQDLGLSRIRRVAQRSEEVLRRLDAGEPLSSVLAQARVVAELHGSKGAVNWLDLDEMYGLGRVPGSRIPLATQEERAAARLFTTLHSVEDTRGVALRIMDGRIMNDQRDDAKIHERTHVNPKSIGETEGFVLSPKVEMPLVASDRIMTAYVQGELNRSENARVI